MSLLPTLALSHDAIFNDSKTSQARATVHHCVCLKYIRISCCFNTYCTAHSMYGDWQLLKISEEFSIFQMKYQAKVSLSTKQLLLAALRSSRTMCQNEILAAILERSTHTVKRTEPPSCCSNTYVGPLRWLSWLTTNQGVETSVLPTVWRSVESSALDALSIYRVKERHVFALDMDTWTRHSMGQKLRRCCQMFEWHWKSPDWNWYYVNISYHMTLLWYHHYMIPMNMA